ncbi:MAG: DUF2807 domain-containing protein [Bacteroidales bacterium]|nr:DUF2807 domain-containing protein [Bacteroidales bacterium]
MKRALFILTAVLLPAALSASVLTKDFTHLGEFIGIQVENRFEVHLIQSDGEYSVTATIDADYEEYLSVKIMGGILYVKLDEMPKKLNNLQKKVQEVTIKVPSLVQINLSGLATLDSEGTFGSPMGTFKVNAGGMSKIKNLEINGGEVDVNAGGKSNVSISGCCSDLEIEASGVAACTVTGDYEEVSMQVSGTSRVTLIGKGTELEGECSGGGYIDAILFPVDKAEIEASGASRATLDVAKELEIEMTGTSSCQYKTSNPQLIIKPSIGRASSLKKLN